MNAIGFVIVLGAVIGSFLLAGGNFGIVAHALPHEMMTIVGAAIGAFIVGNSFDVLKSSGKGLLKALKGPRFKRTDYIDLLCLLLGIAKALKADGPLKLEPHIEAPKESSLFSRYPRLAADHHLMDFLCDYIRLMTINFVDAFQASDAMEADLERHHALALQPKEALQALADSLPAIGIVAAVLGVIKTMGSINQPVEVLGGMIGGALVGTFLGVLLSYCFVAPLAARLGQVLEEEHKPLEIARIVLTGYLAGQSPQVAVELARRAIPARFAPGFAEFEAASADAPKA
jgi:chemotaxis protein MotA